MLAAMETATRLRQVTCPWQALRDPFVVAVLQAYGWREGRLAENFGGEIPEAVRRGLDVYESALASVQAHDREIDRRRREAEAEDRAGGHGTRPPISRYR